MIGSKKVKGQPYLEKQAANSSFAQLKQGKNEDTSFREYPPKEAQIDKRTRHAKHTKQSRTQKISHKDQQPISGRNKIVLNWDKYYPYLTAKRQTKQKQTRIKSNKKQTPSQISKNVSAPRNQNEQISEQLKPDLTKIPRDKVSDDEDEGVVCIICLQTLAPNLLIPFSNQCDHACCQPCLKQHITHQLAKFQPIKCFHHMCKQTIYKDSDHYKKMSAQDKHKYNKILNQHEINSHPNRRICPRTGCNGYIFTDNPSFTCVLCKREFCKQCLNCMHMGKCDDNSRLILENTLQYKSCPRCKMYIQLNKGCNHMTCRCGHQFCYLCLARWTHGHQCNRPQQPHAEPFDIRNRGNHVANAEEIEGARVNALRPARRTRSETCQFICLYLPWLLIFDLLMLSIGIITASLIISIVQFCRLVSFAKTDLVNYLRDNADPTCKRVAVVLLMVVQIIFPFWVLCADRYQLQRLDRYGQYSQTLRSYVFPCHRFLSTGL